MKKQLLKKAATFIVMAMFLFYAANAQAQTETTIDSLILNSMSNHHMPGLAAAIVKDGKMVWAKGYGYANIEKNIPFTKNTINANISFPSHSITVIALLQLWEQGRFQLDDPINNYLPFTINNPYHPTTPITFRMLLKGTSSIAEYSTPEFNFDYNTTTTEPLGSYLYNTLNPMGTAYVDSLYFIDQIPGSNLNAGDINYTLIGFLVAHISGVSFDNYCNNNIFQPLCMNNTGWFFSDVDVNVVSRPYRYDTQTASSVDYGLYESLLYPSNQLKTSVVDYAKFMLMQMNNGTFGGARILKNSTIEFMRNNLIVLSPNFSYGPGIFFLPKYCGTDYWALGGKNTPGTWSRMYYDLVHSTGIIMLVNGDKADPSRTCNNDDLIHVLASFAATIPTADKPALNCSYVSTPCEHGTAFWKSNTDKWALNSIPMKLGTRHYYDKQRVLGLLNKPANGDASIVLAKQLIAAKLNAAQGSELSPIISTINAANDLIADRLFPIQPKISFYSSKGIQMLAFAAQLNLYNYRFLNSGNCSGNSYRGESEVNEMEAEMNAGNEIAVSPNPVTNFTTISFTTSQSQHVSLKVFDVNGRLVTIITDAVIEEGNYSVEWNAEKVNAGIYFLQLQSEEFSKMEKLIVTK